MLAELIIENFAIIERVHLRFGPGLTVLTGETGAGKSIIIDALQAALGARVPSDVVRSDTRYAAVEALFDLSTLPEAGRLRDLLAEQGIDLDGELILRREINAGGRGSARLNGRAVPLNILAAAGSRLVDIHGQSDHLSVLRRDRQLEVIDRYGGLTGLRAEVGEAVREYGRLRQALDDLNGGQREAVQRLDLLRFQVHEIEAARLIPGEEEELSAERNRLANAERLAGLAETAYERLQADSGSALDRIGEALNSTRDLAAIDPALGPIDERLHAARYDLEDIAQELRTYRDSIEFDPRRLDGIEERLDLLTRLRRKYGATVDDVLEFGRQARQAMEEVESLDERIESLGNELAVAADRAGAVASELSERRAQVACDLATAMRSALQGLGLGGTAFEVQLSRMEAPDGLLIPGSEEPYAYNQTGIDAAAFLVAFNAGEQPRPLDRVASGGETSRFLLALKSVLAGADETPTLVFDEVDVGVGARHGMVVGERMRQLARTHQVLSITHLPQIAALADEHLTVAKAIQGGRTGITVRAVASAERVLEIAQMMSGGSSENARRSAEELLEAAQRQE